MARANPSPARERGRGDGTRQGGKISSSTKFPSTRRVTLGALVNDILKKDIALFEAVK